jgi:hypothetical protein
MKRADNSLKLPAPGCLDDLRLPANIERHVFIETRLTAYRLKAAA